MNSETIIQNLKDSGCDEKTITAITKNFCEKNYMGGIKLLEAHRRALLDELHREQKRIDCLDYLVYKMKKENLI